MRNPARVFISIFVSFFFFFVFLSILPLGAHAQTQSPVSSVSDFVKMNADATVPRNQHTFTQAAIIETLSAFTCILTGIDPINPQMPCLNIDPTTHKLSYAPSGQNPEEHVGGVLGATANMIGILYTPAVSSSEYGRYLSENFGIVKTVHAAPANGFEGLRPVLNLWKASRNIAYFLLTVAFILIGLGVMLRIRIDPRTVMTVQNQIPNTIIAIILITLSYPIVGFMIDIMWATTYTGVNLIAAADTTPIPCNNTTTTVAQQGTQKILQTPIGYMSSLFMNKCGDQGGIQDLTIKVANAIGLVVRDAIHSLFLPDNANRDCVHWLGVDLAGCLGNVFSVFFDWVVRIVMLLIVFVAIVVALFKTWWELLKAYVSVLVYVISTPIYIVFGLLPGKPLGFGKAMRGIGANLLAFMLTAWMFVGARVFVDNYSTAPQDKFIPPLVGNPNTPNFGALIAFGIILLTPTIVSLMKEKLKAPSTKQSAAMAAGFLGAGAAVGGFAKKNWAHLNRRNPQTHQPQGIVAVGREWMGSRIPRVLPVVGGRIAAQKQFMSQQGHHGTKQEMLEKGIDTRSYWKKRRDEKRGVESPVDKVQREQKEKAWAEEMEERKAKAAWQEEQEKKEGGAPTPAAPTEPRRPSADEHAAEDRPEEEAIARRPDEGEVGKEATEAEGKEKGEGETAKEMNVENLTLHANSVSIAGGEITAEGATGTGLAGEEGAEGAEAAGASVRHFPVADPDAPASEVMQSMRPDGAPEFDLSGPEEQQWARPSVTYRQVQSDPTLSSKFLNYLNEKRRMSEIDEGKFLPPEPPETTT